MKRKFRFMTRVRPAATPQVKATNINAPPMDAGNGTSTLPSANTTGPAYPYQPTLATRDCLEFHLSRAVVDFNSEALRVQAISKGHLAVSFTDSIAIDSAQFAQFTDHHGIVVFSQRVKVPVGPSAPSSATRTTSREPSSTDSVPSYPLRFVLVKPGETRLTLIPVASSSTIIPNVIALRA